MRDPSDATAGSDGTDDPDGEEQFPYPRDRHADIVDRPLSPASLCGSFFHRLEGETITLQGLVVAEPQAGKYLCELFDWGVGQPTHQALFTIDEMCADDGTEWHFYDSDQWMRRAFERLAKRKEACEQS